MAVLGSSREPVVNVGAEHPSKSVFVLGLISFFPPKRLGLYADASAVIRSSFSAKNLPNVVWRPDSAHAPQTICVAGEGLPIKEGRERGTEKEGGKGKRR